MKNENRQVIGKLLIVSILVIISFVSLLYGWEHYDKGNSQLLNQANMKTIIPKDGSLVQPSRLDTPF